MSDAEKEDAILASLAAALSGALGAVCFIIARDDLDLWNFWERRLHAIALVFALVAAAAGFASLWMYLRDSAARTLALVTCCTLHIAAFAVGVVALLILYDPLLLILVAAIGCVPIYLVFHSLIDNLYEIELPYGGVVRRTGLALASVAFCVATWPVGGLFLGALSGWLLARGRTRWWADALAKVLLPTWIGAFASGTLFLLANAAKALVPGRHLHRAETTLLGVRNALLSITTPSWLVICALIIGLAVVSARRPDLRILERTGKTRDALATTVLLLTACCSFTFFSAVPLDDLANTVHERQAEEFATNVEEYIQVLRDDWKNVGNQLAAEALRRAITRAGPAAVQAHRNVLAALDSALAGAENDFSFCDEGESLRDWAIKAGIMQTQSCLSSRDELRREVVRDVARTRVRYPAQPVAAYDDFPAELRRQAFRRQGWEAFRRVPHLPGDWSRRTTLIERQRELIARASTRRDLNAARTREVMTGARQLFVETVGLAAPELKGLAGHYADEMLGSSAERFFERTIARWYARHPQALGEEMPPAAREAMIQEAVLHERTITERPFSTGETDPLRLTTRSSLAAHVRGIAADIQTRHLDAQRQERARQRILRQMEEARARRTWFRIRRR